VFSRYVLGDLEIAYKMYVPSVEELCQQNPHHNLVYKMDSIETVILFHLRALADLGKYICFLLPSILYCTFYGRYLIDLLFIFCILNMKYVFMGRWFTLRVRSVRFGKYSFFKCKSAEVLDNLIVVNVF
jgi:hypothetical protein